MKYFIIVSGMILTWLTFCPAAGAQLFIEEGKVVLNVKAGDSVRRTIKVYNTSDEPFDVRVYWEDFVYQPPFDGNKKFLPAGVGERSMAQWVSFTPKSFTLPQYGKKEISYVINVPKDVSGGYYSVLFFEKEPKAVRAQKGLSVAARVGSLFFVETFDKKKVGRVAGLAAQGSTVSGRIDNRGNVVLIPEGVFYVMDTGGVAVQRGRIENLYIPPGETGVFVFKVNETLPAGSYTAVINFDVSEDDFLIKEMDFRKDAQGDIAILGTRD